MTISPQARSRPSPAGRHAALRPDARRQPDTRHSPETRTASDPRVRPAERHVATTVDLVVPVYNEERALTGSIERLLAACLELPWHVSIVIADNGSTDGTAEVAAGLERAHPGVRCLRLGEKGRGRALKAAWRASTADVVAYTDVDLSTDLAALAPLIAVLASGHSDVAIATRLGRSSRVTRGAKREIISRCYNVLLRAGLGIHYSDAQCGFKGMTRAAADAVLPHVRDDNWFFDTEMLTLAEWSGLRIQEFPADWDDDPDSRVDILATAREDLRGMARMQADHVRGRLPLDMIAGTVGRRPKPSQLLPHAVRFAGVGVICTLAFALLYVLAAPIFGAQSANLVALLATTVLNTALNRRYTFGVRGRHWLRHHAQGLLVFGLCWALTAGSLALLHAAWPLAGTLTELTVLTAANIVATALRFLLLRGWVFAPQFRSNGENS